MGKDSHNEGDDAGRFSSEFTFFYESMIGPIDELMYHIPIKTGTYTYQVCLLDCQVIHTLLRADN